MATVVTGGRITTITAAILAILLADLGTTDLSATGRVRFGRWVQPATIPFLGVDLIGINTDPDKPIGTMRRIAVFHLEGWQQVIVDDPIGGLVAFSTMATEVLGALENSHRDVAGTIRTTMPYVLRLWHDQIELHNTEINGMQLAHWTARLYVEYNVEIGI